MIRIYITAYIKPEFISLQYETFKKYCKDEYEIVVINNGVNREMADRISQLCNSLGLCTIDIIKKGTQAEYCSQSHSIAIEYALQNVIKKEKIEGLNVILDSDIFAFRPFSFVEMMKGNLIGGMYQQRGTYEYPAGIIIMLDGSLDLTDFSFHLGMGDTGGSVNWLMTKFNITPEWIKHTAAIDIETNYIFRCNNEPRYKPMYRSQFITDALIHYYRGSNWEGNNPALDREKWIFINNLISHPEDYCLHLDDNVLYEYAQANKGYNGADHHYHNYRYIDNVK